MSSVGWKSSDGMEFRFPWCDLSLVLVVEFSSEFFSSLDNLLLIIVTSLEFLSTNILAPWTMV